jgi:hypothetical protein
MRKISNTDLPNLPDSEAILITEYFQAKECRNGHLTRVGVITLFFGATEFMNGILDDIFKKNPEITDFPLMGYFPYFQLLFAVFLLLLAGFSMMLVVKEHGAVSHFKNSLNEAGLDVSEINSKDVFQQIFLPRLKASGLEVNDED